MTRLNSSNSMATWKPSVKVDLGWQMAAFMVIKYTKIQAVQSNKKCNNSSWVFF